jgi:hypothetical protein
MTSINIIKAFSTSKAGGLEYHGWFFVSDRSDVCYTFWRSVDGEMLFSQWSNLKYRSTCNDEPYAMGEHPIIVDIYERMVKSQEWANVDNYPHTDEISDHALIVAKLDGRVFGTY